MSDNQQGELNRKNFPICSTAHERESEYTRSLDQARRAMNGARKAEPAAPKLSPIETVIGTALGRVARDLKAEIDELRREVVELKARSGVSWKGVWSPNVLYADGDLVTRSGSMWCAKEATYDQPPSDAWVLIVKSGHVEPPPQRFATGSRTRSHNDG